MGDKTPMKITTTRRWLFILFVEPMSRPLQGRHVPKGEYEIEIVSSPLDTKDVVWAVFTHDGLKYCDSATGLLEGDPDLYTIHDPERVRAEITRLTKPETQPRSQA